MTDRRITRQVTETSSQPLPGNALTELRGEVLSRAAAGSLTAELAAETASAPWPPDRAAMWLAEVLAKPWPPLVGPVFVVEVLRRDTAASAIVATGMDAFGDTPWPQAQRGVFACRHDWAEPLVERLAWQTSVTRLASGNESRPAARCRAHLDLSSRQRASGRCAGGRLAGRPAGPTRVVATAAVRRAADRARRSRCAGPRCREADWRYFVPASADLWLDWNCVQGWQGDEIWALLIAPDGWQQVQLSQVEPDTLWLTEPWPARATGQQRAAGGVARLDPADLTQWVPGMVGGNVVAQIEPAPPPDTDLLDDPWLDNLPVWPDGNWRDDPTAVASTTITRQDFSPADVRVPRRSVGNHDLPAALSGERPG